MLVHAPKDSFKAAKKVEMSKKVEVSLSQIVSTSSGAALVTHWGGGDTRMWFAKNCREMDECFKQFLLQLMNILSKIFLHFSEYYRRVPFPYITIYTNRSVQKGYEICHTNFISN